MAFKNNDDVIKFIKDEGIEFLDIRFTDVPGMEHHFTLPASDFDEDAATAGMAFDGSSIRGFTTIEESDMTLLPDPTTAYVDPFRTVPTLNMQFFVNDPFTYEAFSRDPRNVAKKAEEYLASTGIANSASFGLEAEFYLFDKVSYAAEANSAFYHLDSSEGWWNRANETELDGSPNLGNKTRMKGGYFPNTPVDKTQEVRDAIVKRLQQVGFEVERFHHEVGTGGQNEVNYRFDTLLQAADDLQTFKYIVKNTAQEHGTVATFMPKPLAGDNGSGMHAHQSLWKDGEPLFYDESGYGGLSDTARYYIGGLLHHAPAVLAFTNPTLNSYHRLVKGFEAPINLVYSQRNRSAAVRIPITGSSPKAKRLEFRAPDPSGNPYLGLTAMLMAGIDGIKNRIEPHAPVDKDLYELPPEEAASIPQAPTSLEAALEALREDHEFLTEGDVFTQDLIETYIDYKYENEIQPARLRPTPLEFEMYFDC
ncbi:type I glutamate--ammonia ligase [Corynebacterium yudongzhengii]|uniref:Glutamine synthetase n=1 Tax=Corynebacterium yudongzhengii TaxID=2080740 RepID=A0A2U1T7C3_9CORY|nr:type I glutamate--ammonia ligase [Corynebacterium yudongzhengii]AWB81525.1 type I glutamate--ammonia ligase [Corynebacterium yudongzhengii]PWC01904.1 type I glutamate--ammonia ligase [Corynebacterium yudongzhengii]